MRNYPTLRQMQYLVALHETKNFREAAEICNITQPTLSAAIKEMEFILGVDVLDRSKAKSVIFSSFGEEVVATATRVIAPMEALMEKAKNHSAPLSGPIRLGMIPTIAPYLLPDILPRLQKAFPDIEWQIVEAMSAALITQLNAGKINLAIMAFPYETGDLKYSIFLEEPFYCAAQAGTYKKGQILTLHDLDAHKLLLLEDGHCLRDHALSACKLQNIRDKRALSATSLPTLIQMVSHGYGITLLPAMMLNQGVIPKNVVLHKFKNPQPSRKIGAAWRGKDPQIETIKAITKELRNIL